MKNKIQRIFSEINSPLPNIPNHNYEDPMSRPRLSIIGKLEKYNSAIAKRFLSRHPVSNLYANFSDMNLYKLQIINAHLTAYFAKVKWFGREDLTCDNVFEENEEEFEVISHMNHN